MKQAAELTTGTTGLEASRRQHWNNHILRHSLMQPDAVALRYLGENTTWKQLNERTRILASALRRRGVNFGDRVLILMLNRPENVETAFALNLLGAIAVPVNIRNTPSELAFLVQDCAAKLVVTESVLAPLANALCAQVPGIESLVIAGEFDADQQSSAPRVESFEKLLAEEADDLSGIDVPESSPALIIYTSGTTGKPKGATLTHANMQAQSLTIVQALNTSRDDIGSCIAPMFHIAALGSMAPLIYMGATTYVHPLGAFDPEELLDIFEAEAVTSTFLVPAQWQAVCAAQKAKPRNLALRVISWGAAPASDVVLNAMSEMFPKAMNVAVFGQTEMSPVTCALDGVDAIRKLGSVGKVVPGVQARIVDDAMNDVPDGEIGEIIYRGPTLMAGYWDNPQGTAEAFEGGWFHSGDLVRRDAEGFIYVVDRKKDMIISGGENIYCVEVENVLASHPKILEATVVGRTDDKWGEIPVAVVALHPGQELTFEELQPLLNEELSRYKHPKDLVIVDALPRNPSGKVLKHLVRAEFGGKDSGLHQ